MTGSESFEYENVDHETYYKNQKIAIDILAEISKLYSIPVPQIRFTDVINFFFDQFDIKLSIFESTNSNPLYLNPDPQVDLVTFNTTMKYSNINLHAERLDLVNPQFSDNVDGLTFNQNNKHAMFINCSTNYFPRLIFTVLHELSHIYLSETSNKYLGLVAKINDYKGCGDPYPNELRPIETGANIIASELFANKLALESAINSNCTFDEMRTRFGMSKGALHNRILNYLEHSQNFEYSLAKDCTFKIRNNGQAGIDEVKSFISTVNGGKVHNPYTKIDAFDNVIFA